MALQVYPDRYLRFNDQQTKNLNVALVIDGYPFVFSLVQLYTRIRYGDPITYGEPDIVYGGLRPLETSKPYLQMESALTLSQKIEPEQGRSSISTLSFNLIDKDGELSALISPGGGVLPEVMGRGVKVFLGYNDTSYPDDYYVVFRGLITQTTVVSGRVTLGVSDPNQRKRQVICRDAKTPLTSPITSVSTSIPIVSGDDFYHQITGPSGSVDSAIRTWIKIDDEYMEYFFGGITTTTVTVARGGANSRGTTAVSHASGSDVSHAIEFTDNCIDMALKIMLSGWNGPFISDVVPVALGTAIDPALATFKNVILLSSDSNIYYGLTIGDYVTVTGSSFSNDGTYRITDIQEGIGGLNRLLYIDTDLTLENPATGVTLAFRSQYDTYPTQAGLKLSPADVDVFTHKKTKSRYFFGTENRLKIFVNSQQTGKSFIESEVYLPVGAYGLTRYGRLSMGYTRPPIPEDKLVFLDNTNILEPDKIQISRGLNNRRFFNEIEYQYDVLDDGNTFTKVFRKLDTDSLNIIGQSSVLPIKSLGIKSSLGGALLVLRRANNLLSRYKKAAFEINCKVNFAAGSIIEAGDVIVLTDNGTLFLTNFDTGKRDLEQKLFEVINRSMDIKTGQVSLTLLSGLDTNLTDRYGTISPSSLIDASLTTTTSLYIKDSFGAVFPGKEYLKWKDYVGLPVLVHSPDWSLSAERKFIGINSANPYILELDPSTPLPFTPLDDYIVDIARYPTSTNRKENQLYKLLHVVWMPSIAVVSGTSSTVFDVSAPDAATFNVGQPILVHNDDYSILSTPERKVLSIVGTTITVDGSLGFTPAAGQHVEGIGFPDGGGPYRLL